MGVLTSCILTNPPLPTILIFFQNKYYKPKEPKSIICAIVLKQEGSFLMLLVAYNLTIREYLSVNKVTPQSFIITEGIQRTYYNMRYLYIMPIF